MLEYIESFLYQVAVALSYPVFFALALMILWSVYSAGDFFREWVDRRRGNVDPVRSFTRVYETQLDKALAATGMADIHLTRIVRVWEKNRISRLDRVRFMVKVAPSIGLIGTLIPMGIALSSLSTGDLISMSSNMVNAFTATIAGLACSVVAYLISQEREKWLKTDFLEVETRMEELLRKLEHHEAAGKNGRVMNMETLTKELFRP